jgi:hypothetical protein
MAGDTYNTKNYAEQGGEKWVIGGTLEFAEGAKVEGLLACGNQPDSTASTIADLRADFNLLLAKLKAAGLMATGE